MCVADKVKKKSLFALSLSLSLLHSPIIPFPSHFRSFSRFRTSLPERRVKRPFLSSSFLLSLSAQIGDVNDSVVEMDPRQESSGFESVGGSVVAVRSNSFSLSLRKKLESELIRKLPSFFPGSHNSTVIYLLSEETFFSSGENLQPHKRSANLKEGEKSLLSTFAAFIYQDFFLLSLSLVDHFFRQK